MARQLSNRDKALARRAKRQGQSGFAGDGGVWYYMSSLSESEYSEATYDSDNGSYGGSYGGSSSYDSGSSSSDCGGGGGGD